MASLLTQFLTMVFVACSFRVRLSGYGRRVMPLELTTYAESSSHSTSSDASNQSRTNKLLLELAPASSLIEASPKLTSGSPWSGVSDIEKEVLVTGGWQPYIVDGKVIWGKPKDGVLMTLGKKEEAIQSVINRHPTWPQVRRYLEWQQWKQVEIAKRQSLQQPPNGQKYFVAGQALPVEFRLPSSQPPTNAGPMHQRQASGASMTAVPMLYSPNISRGQPMQQMSVVPMSPAQVLYPPNMSIVPMQQMSAMPGTPMHLPIQQEGYFRQSISDPRKHPQPSSNGVYLVPANNGPWKPFIPDPKPKPQDMQRRDSRTGQPQLKHQPKARKSPKLESIPERPERKTVVRFDPDLPKRSR